MNRGRTRLRTAAVVLLVLLAGAAACERRGPPGRDGVRAPTAGPGSPAGAGGAEASVTRECVNAVDGYSVRYPAEWHVNASPPFRPCSFFDADALEIPVASEVPIEIAVTIGVEAVDLATATGETLGRRDLAREPVMIAGRRALRIEGETTGEGLYDRGIRSYQYFVDLGERTLIGTTYDAGPLPFERKRETLDAMMRSLELRARAQDARSSPAGRIIPRRDPAASARAESR